MRALRAFRKYGHQANSHDLLKAAALLLMVLDHLGTYFFPEHEVLRVLGRGAAPLFLFLVGYNKQYTIKKSLIAYAALLSAFEFIWLGQIFLQNILWLIIVTRLFLKWYAKKIRYDTYDATATVFAAMVLWPLTFWFAEYGTEGVLFAVVGLWCAHRGASARLRIFLIASAIAWYFFIQGTYWFTFSGTDWATLIGMMSFLGYSFFRYRFHSFARLPKPIATPIKIAGRYSLEIYVAHLMLFILLSSYSS